MFKNALVSCSDKSGLAEFLKPLQAKGLRIVSTGGTAKLLREKGLTVIEVADQTGFAEVMDGRVKTLHPNVHMALLAREDNKEDMATLEKFKLAPFDLVIGNLYPFEEEPSIETIDIGGPSFLRAAAKNFSRITVICNPEDYKWVSEKPEMTLHDRQLLAAKVFYHTSAYDSMIGQYYSGENSLSFHDHSLGGHFVQKLRYGENPQQAAAWFSSGLSGHGIHKAQILQGKELSYNNLLDIESAVSTVREFSSKPACVAVKHNSPCGAACADEATVAFTNAISADPQSVFGGIIATNQTVNAAMADKLSDVFIECVVAPKFEDEAKQKLAKKKNLRVLEWPDMMIAEGLYSYRSISGGFLIQQKDSISQDWDSSWQIIGKKPTAAEQKDLLFAWKISAHLKSNAIALVSGEQTMGLGMGQVNRVDSVEQAIARWRHFHADKKQAVLASDAFFPFADSIEKIADAGIRFVIQPGGSVKDNEVIAAAERLGVTLVMTGRRHFLH